MFGFNKIFFKRSAALFLAAASLHLGASPFLKADEAAKTKEDADFVNVVLAGKTQKVPVEVAKVLAQQNQQLSEQKYRDEVAQPGAAAVAGFDDITSAELQNAFLNFEVAREGDDPTHITLYGMIFDDCLKAGQMQITNTKTDPAILNRTPGVAGFRITDRDQQGRKCMAEHMKNHDVCNKQFSCTSIDQLPGAVMVLHEKDDFKIQLGHFDPNRSRNPVQWEEFPEAQEVYQGQKSRAANEDTRRAAADEANMARRERYLKALESQVKTCRKNHDDRMVALDAADILEAEGLKTSEEVEKIKKEIYRAELRDLATKFGKAKDQDDIDAAMEALKQFVEEHPESDKVADSVANLCHQKAGLVVKEGHNAESYDVAKGLIAACKDITGISKASEKVFETDELGIQVGRFQTAARSGNTDPYEFWNGYSSMMWDLKSQVSDCYGGGYSQSCGGTVQAFSAAMKIPQIAQQTSYERYMFQMQMQQQMNAAFGQWGGQYSPGGNFMGAPNMMGMNPMGMNNMNFGSMGNMGGMGNMGMMNSPGFAPNAFSSFGGGSPFFQ